MSNRGKKKEEGNGMKVNYRKSRADAEYERHARKYGMLYLEYIDTCIGVIMAQQFRWARVRLQRFFDHERDYIADQIERYMPDRMTTHDKKGARFADEGERTYDSMQSVLHVLTRELRGIGVDYDPEALRGYDGFEDAKHTKLETAVYHVRKIWYDGAGKLAGDVYIAGALMYFHNECGFGKERLRQILEPLEAFVQNYMTAFWRVSGASDKATEKLLADMQKILEERGITLIECDDDGVVVEKKKPADVAGRNKIFENLMEETKNGRQVYSVR